MTTTPNAFATRRATARHAGRLIVAQLNHDHAAVAWRYTYIGVVRGKVGLYRVISALLRTAIPHHSFAQATLEVLRRDKDGSVVAVDNPDVEVPAGQLAAVRMMTAISTGDYEMAWALFRPHYPGAWPWSASNSGARVAFGFALYLAADRVQRMVSHHDQPDRR